MKRLPLAIVLALSTLLSACESRDAKWEKALIGTWHTSSKNADGLAVDGNTTYLADGKMQAAGTIKYQDQTLEFKGVGTWTVAKGYLQWTASESNIPKLIPVGYTASDKIISVTDKEYTYVDSDTGKTEVEYRVK